MSRHLLAALGLGTVSLVASATHAEVRGEATELRAQAHDTPIIGGTTVTSADTWADTVAVLGAQGVCSGTLIAPDVVLTAGHCAEVNPTQVKLKTTDYNGAGGITAAVKSITAYPNWETTYDVSVIVLTAPVAGVTPRKVATACTFQTGWTNSAMVHLVGFGAIDTAAQGNNSKLYEVSVPLTDAMCSAGNGCKPAVAPGGEFAAGGNGKDSCNGDSGGPVYLDTARGPILVGAVSRATDSATAPCGEGGIYVRTDKVLQWLETTTGKTIAKDTCGATTDPTDPTNPTDPTDPTDPTAPKPDPTGNGSSQDIVGGCSAGGTGAGFVLVLGALASLRRRRV
ncbi:MAG: trypsin-like serine protease [Proteobacteria bacterium]|nr:trypsin-like serine protease [Pseudomonadota bacterium]